jgi:hypothetical protein
VVSLAGVKDARVAGEHLLHHLRVRKEDPDTLVRDAQREHVAVAPMAALHERRGPEHPANRL